jgi:hypothetical protein
MFRKSGISVLGLTPGRSSHHSGWDHKIARRALGRKFQQGVPAGAGAQRVMPLAHHASGAPNSRQPSRAPITAASSGSPTLGTGVQTWTGSPLVLRRLWTILDAVPTCRSAAPALETATGPVMLYWQVRRRCEQRPRTAAHPARLGLRPLRLGSRLTGTRPSGPLNWTGRRDHREDGKVVMTERMLSARNGELFGGDCRMARGQLSAGGYL